MINLNISSFSLAMLQSLIQESLANSVEFVYSISPGLDIVFSSDVDVRCLLEKLTQVII